MIVEMIAATLLGALLLWLALGPSRPAVADLDEHSDPFEETPRGRALLAIKELDFDKATGKLSEEDYQQLKTRLSREAARLLSAPGSGNPSNGAGPSPACRKCGTLSESVTRFCVTCGAATTTG
mgnify:CR=1 FL=1